MSCNCDIQQKQRSDYVAKPAVTPVPPTPTPPPPPALGKIPTPPLPPISAPAASERQDPSPADIIDQNNSSEIDSVTMRDSQRERPPPANRTHTHTQTHINAVCLSLTVCLSMCVSLSGRKSNMEEVQDELMHRLTLGRSAQKKLQTPARSTSGLSVNISYDSAPEEVTAWLQLKGFSAV